MAKKYVEKTYSRKLRGYSSIADSVEKVTKPIFDKRGSVEGKILLKWPVIVGSDISKMAVPNKISFSRKNDNLGVLYLNVDNMYITDIQYMKDDIIGKIAMYFGYNVISDIKCKQVFFEVSDNIEIFLGKKNLAISDECNNMIADLVQDEGLKKVLLSLSKGIL